MGLNMWREHHPYAADSSAIGADGYKAEAVEGMLGLTCEDMMSTQPGKNTSRKRSIWGVPHRSVCRI